MVRIIGEGIFPEAKAFYDVRDSLKFDRDIYLSAHLSKLIGLRLDGQVIYNLEPLYDGCRSLSIGYMDVLRSNIVVDYSAVNVEYLARHGIEAFHMPYGYHDSLERAVPDKKDIDVLCVGSINPRRQLLFDRLSKECNFMWAQGVYGPELDKLISRAKVHVNVHFADDHPLEVVRLNYLMANHCNVVSEEGNESTVNDMYRSGIRFAPYGKIIEACYEAMLNPIDGYETIKAIPHDCTYANRWVNEKFA